MRRHTQETKDEILRLWNANMGSNGIARRFGLTKNMVVSIVRRARKKGLDVRVGDTPAKGHRKKSQAPRPKKVDSPQVPIVYVPSDYRIPRSVKTSDRRWVPLLHLGNETCRYTRDGRLFCNAMCRPKTSYCEEHAKSMYAGHHSVLTHLRYLGRR